MAKFDVSAERDRPELPLRASASVDSAPSAEPASASAQSADPANLPASERAPLTSAKPAQADSAPTPTPATSAQPAPADSPEPTDSAPPSPLVLVKIGGRALDGVAEILRDMALLPYHWILLHGGGAQVSDISRRYGIEPRFERGIRQTSSAEMDIIDMGLAGLVNSSILRTARALGIRAVGLSGIDAGLFTASKLSEHNFTGRVLRVQTDVVLHLLSGGYLPVISPVSATAQGEGVNINADDAASALATALAGGGDIRLVYLSDIDGVYADVPPHQNRSEAQTAGSPEHQPEPPIHQPKPRAERRLVHKLNAHSARSLIQNGTIQGGMIAKIESALECLSAGVRSVAIGQVERRGDLERIIAGERGTRLVL